MVRKEITQFVRDMEDSKNARYKQAPAQDATPVMMPQRRSVG
jgi:hypothetical protein